MKRDNLKNEIVKDVYLRLACNIKNEGKPLDPDTILQDAIDIAEGYIKVYQKLNSQKPIPASAWLGGNNGT